jgi:hypothetical protein
LANIINSFTQSAAGNVLTSTVNGVVATSSIITSNSLSVSTSTGILTSSVNGVATTTDLSPLLATQNLQKVTDNGATTTNTINVQNLAGQYSHLGGANLTFGTSYNNNSTRLDFAAPAGTSNTVYLPGTNSGVLALSVNGITANGSGAITLTPSSILNYYAETNSAHQIAAPTASGLSSVAIGDGAQANANVTMAFGYNAQANNDGAVVIGTSGIASGQGSYSIGDLNNSTGFQSYAFGNVNNVAAGNAYAFGMSNDVNTASAYAYGFDNTINADNAYTYGELNNIEVNQNLSKILQRF